MNVNKILEKEGIKVIAQVSEDIKLSLMQNITQKICNKLPYFNLDKQLFYNKLCELNLYYAELKQTINEANYLYKNKTIYINVNVTKDKMEDFILHEVIHYLQERTDKFGHLKKMGLCNYSYLSVTGLALNEAATQHLTAYLLDKPYEDVRYFGISFRTNSPTYYPVECAIVSQLDYLIENKTLFKSTLLSDSDFYDEMEKYFPKDTIETIMLSLDEMLEDEEKIAILNGKIVEFSDRNKPIDKLINKINKLKSNLLVKFMRTQNLIFSSYFDNLYDKIINFEQVDYYRKKLYNFRDLIGTAEGYTFFDDYYINKMVELNKKVAEIENGGLPQDLATVNNSLISKILRKLATVFKLNSAQNSYNEINNK